MPYGFNDDKSKNDMSDVVRAADIADVVRKGDIAQKVYSNQITIDGSSANFTIANSVLAVQGSIAYIFIALNVKAALTANTFYSLPIKLPNNLKLLRAVASTPQAVDSDDTRFKGSIAGHTSSYPTLPNKDVLTLSSTGAVPTTNPPMVFYGIIMLQG